MNLTKTLRFFSLGIMIISALVCLLYFFTVSGTQFILAGIVTEDFFLIWAYIMTGIACAGVVIFTIAEIITNPKTARSAIISIGSLAAVVVAAYLIATDEIPHFLGSEKFNLTTGDVKWIGASLITAYILMGIATLGILYAEVSKMFNK